MSLLLEVDRLLPFCNNDPVMADRLVCKTHELLSDSTLSSFERALKLADAFKHANNHLKSRLLCSLSDTSISSLTNQIDSLQNREQLMKRLVLIWECDDAYTKALACLIFKQFDMHESVECWYRLRQSAKSGVGVERGAARSCIDLFEERLHDRVEWREMMNGIIMSNKA